MLPAKYFDTNTQYINDLKMNQLNVSRLAWKDLVFPLARKFHPPKALFEESAIEAQFFLTI